MLGCIEFEEFGEQGRSRELELGLRFNGGLEGGLSHGALLASSTLNPKPNPSQAEPSFNFCFFKVSGMLSA